MNKCIWCITPFDAFQFIHTIFFYLFYFNVFVYIINACVLLAKMYANVSNVDKCLCLSVVFVYSTQIGLMVAISCGNRNENEQRVNADCICSSCFAAVKIYFVHSSTTSTTTRWGIMCPIVIAGFSLSLFLPQFQYAMRIFLRGDCFSIQHTSHAQQRMKNNKFFFLQISNFF